MFLSVFECNKALHWITLNATQNNLYFSWQYAKKLQWNDLKMTKDQWIFMCHMCTFTLTQFLTFDQSYFFYCFFYTLYNCIIYC